MTNKPKNQIIPVKFCYTSRKENFLGSFCFKLNISMTHTGNRDCETIPHAYQTPAGQPFCAWIVITMPTILNSAPESCSGLPAFWVSANLLIIKHNIWSIRFENVFRNQSIDTYPCYHSNLLVFVLHQTAFDTYFWVTASISYDFHYIKINKSTLSF